MASRSKDSQVLRRSVTRKLTQVAFMFLATGLPLLACSNDAKTDGRQNAADSLKAKFSDDGLIMANVVVRAYEQGRLGTREQVEADMEPFFSPPDYNYKIPKPFDDSGKLIPLAAMTDEQLHAFSQWYTSGKVYGILRDEIIAAITESREKKGK